MFWLGLFIFLSIIIIAEVVEKLISQVYADENESSKVLKSIEIRLTRIEADLKKTR